MVPFVAFVTQKKLRREIARPTFLAANAAVLRIRPPRPIFWLRPIFHFHWLRSLSPSPQHHSRSCSRRHSWIASKKFLNFCCCCSCNYLIGIVWIYLRWMKWFGAKFWFRGKWVILAPLFLNVGLPTWTEPAPIIVFFAGKGSCFVVGPYAVAFFWVWSITLLYSFHFMLFFFYRNKLLIINYDHTLVKYINSSRSFLPIFFIKKINNYYSVFREY